MNKLIAAFVISSACLVSPGAMAGVVLNGREYPDAQIAQLRASCAGLQAQANMSLTSDVPDDEYSGDLASEYQLAGLPFDLGDCREAGLV